MRRAIPVLVGTLLVACSEAPPEAAPQDAAEARLVVYATSYPLAYFAERIGGEAVEVIFDAPPGVDPAHWTPDAAGIVRAQDAALLLRHGVGDPAWLGRTSLRRDRIVDTTAAVPERRIARETVAHQHGPGGEHSHGTWAGTSWLDPTLAMVEARAIADALRARRPAQSAVFDAGLAALEADLSELDAALASAAAAWRDEAVLFSHPVYDYLEARTGLNGRRVVWEPGKMPNEAEWERLATLLEVHRARVMLWEAQPLEETAARLATLGVESRVFAPCANRPSEGDWLSVMRANLGALGAPAAGG